MKTEIKNLFCPGSEEPVQNVLHSFDLIPVYSTEISATNDVETISERVYSVERFKFEFAVLGGWQAANDYIKHVIEELNEIEPSMTYRLEAIRKLNRNVFYASRGDICKIREKQEALNAKKANRVKDPEAQKD